MTPQQAELWRKIEAFPLENGEATRGFDQRLARENRWSRRQAEAAIREYRRFLFLLAAGEHPVSPSPIVDQVWHLHLVYTRSYWNELCRDLVGRPLHHGPSTGAPGEDEKFHDWYSQTLASYERHFGEAPPREFWPPPGTPHPDLRWIDARRTWSLPLPRLAWCRATVVGLLATLLTGCMSQWGPTDLGPFDLSGGQFLTFYACVSVIALLLALTIRLWAMRDTSTNVDGSDRVLNFYELAYLAGGPHRVVSAAIVALAQRGCLKLRRSTRSLVRHGSPGADAHPIERVIWDSAGSDVRVRDLRRAAAWDIEGLADRLANRGLAIPSDRAKASKVAMTLLVLTPLAMGVGKIAIGISRDRPVLYLLGLVLASLILGLCILLPPLRRTWRSLPVVRSTRQQHNELKPGAHISPSDLPLAVSLFGVAVLHGTAYDELEKTLTPPTSSYYTGGSCGSSCGGSSSCGGGGSSCGGGCGGCGGGD